MSRVDRFGQPFVNVACKDKKGRGFPKGFIRIMKPGLYKVEPSSSSSTEGVEAWVRVTRVEDRGRADSPFGARGGRRGGF